MTIRSDSKKSLRNIHFLFDAIDFSGQWKVLSKCIENLW